MTGQSLADRLRAIADQDELAGITTPQSSEPEDVGTYFARVFAEDLPTPAAAKTETKPRPNRAQDPPRSTVREINVWRDLELIPGWPDGPNWHQVGVDVWVDSAGGSRLTWRAGDQVATLETPAMGGGPR